MLVRITPPGRRARYFDVPGVTRSWDIAGGCAVASVPLRLSAEDIERILLAKVETFDWTGFVWRQPIEGRPIECAGQAVALTMERKRALYAKSDFLRDLQDFNGQNWGAYSRSVVGGSVFIAQSPGTTSANADQAGYFYYGDEPLSSVSFAWTRSGDANWGLVVYPLDITQAPGAPAYSSATTGATTATFPAGTYGFIVTAQRTDAVAVGDTSHYVSISGMTIYGVDFSVTAANVLDDILDDVPTWALPAGAEYRRWMLDPNVSMASLHFDDPTTDGKEKVDAVVAMTDHHFGFYPEWVGMRRVGVPHLTPIETTPTLALDLEGGSLSGASVDSLASRFLVSHPNDAGRTTYTLVDDTDPLHYLNRIGYDRDVPLRVPWTTSATLAQAVGTVAAARSDISGAEGAATVRRVRLANGREAPFSMLRPGKCARTYVDGRRRTLLVRGVQATDGGSYRATFGTSPTDLRALTAKATGRSVNY